MQSSVVPALTLPLEGWGDALGVGTQEPDAIFREAGSEREQVSPASVVGSCGLNASSHCNNGESHEKATWMHMNAVRRCQSASNQSQQGQPLPANAAGIDGPGCSPGWFNPQLLTTHVRFSCSHSDPASQNVVSELSGLELKSLTPRFVTQGQSGKTQPRMCCQ